MRAFDQQTIGRRGTMTLGGKESRMRRARVRRHQPGGGFDVLENRQLLSTLDITSGALTYDGVASASDLTVSSTGPGGHDTFTDADQLITLTAAAMTAGWSGSGTNTVTGPYSSVSSTAITNSSTAGQSLTLNYTTGDPLPASGLIYDPTAATGQSTNSLTVESGTGGTTFTSETYSATGAGAGTITYIDSIHSNVPITFSNLSPVNDTVPSPTFIFDAPAASTTVNIVNGPIVGTTQTDQINDGGTGAFELINFGNKTAATANVNNNGATTNVETTTAAAGLTDLFINSGAGVDHVFLETTPAGTTTHVDTGSGANSFTQLGTPALLLSSILGNVDVQSTGGSNALNFADNGEIVPVTYTISGATVTATSMPAAVSFDGGISSLNLEMGNGATVNLTGPSQASITTYNFVAKAPAAANTLNIASNVPTLIYSTAGTLTFGAGEPTLDYTNFATINVTKPATPPVGTGTTINATEGQSLNNVVVATFTEPDLGNVTTDFTASINWGDSTTSTGTIQPNGANGYNILGSHTYAAAGTFTVNVTLTDLGSTGTTTVAGTTISVTSNGPVNSSPNPIVSTANTAAAPLVAQGVPVSGFKGVALNPAPGGDVLVATFMDTGTPGSAADYAASINWGDGSAATAPTRITSQGTPNGVVFSVFGNHTYAAAGSFTVVTTITKTASGSTAIAASSATIAAQTALPTDSVENLTGLPISAVQDVEFTKTVGTFTDTSTAAVASDFLASIAWGDGTTTAGTITEDANDTFYVTGTHTYTKAGSFTPVVTIKDPSGTLYATGSFNQTNLVSSVSGMAGVIDPNLINPWGMSSSSTSPIWVSDQGTGKSTLYNPTGNPIKQGLTVTIPATGTPSGPTGQVFNNDTSATDFTIPGPSGAVPSIFIFASLDGTIAGWNPSSTGGTTSALTAATVTGAVFTGLAQGSVTGGATTTFFLYASDFTGTTGASGIDVFSPTFTNVSGTTFAGKFVDPNAAPGFEPYNIALLNGDLFVAYAKPNGIVTSPGGYINEFDTSGNFVKRVYTDVAGTNLTGPWGMAIAPSGFGSFGGDLLVGNFGNSTSAAPNGTIIAINLTTGALAGTVSTPNGTLTNAGIWGLLPGNGGSGGTAGTLYFSAGLNGQTAGLFGGIAFAAAPAVTVAAAPLDTQGATVRGIEGNSLAVSNGTADVMVATFMDTGTPGTAASYSASISWGDGSAATADTRITSQGTPNGTVYSVFGNHTYAAVGTYQVTVTITNSANGAVAIASSQAVIQPPTLAPVIPQPTVTTPERVIFSGPVGEFTDNNPSATASQFSDLIDWGDGSPQSAGTVTLIASSPTITTFEISGTHTYADLYSSTNATSAAQTSSTFPLSIHVVGTDGSSGNLTNTATVTGGPFTITGHLNSASDSGVSDSDGITNVTQPTFNGVTGEPNAKVSLFAQMAGGSLVLIGQGTSGANDNWSITPSIALTNGNYLITATAVDGTNSIVTATSTVVPNLVIDTVGPKVTDVTFNRLIGQIVVTFQDFGGASNAGVGLNAASVIDANNYQLTTVHHPRVGKYRVNAVSDSPGTTTGTQTVTLTINGGTYMKGGWYFFTIRSKSATDLSGVRDIAGNALDGEFYGYVPSGNNVAGGDFVAQLTAIHHTTYAPSTIIGRATPINPPGNRPGSTIHIKETINPGKLPRSLVVRREKATQKAEIKVEHRSMLGLRKETTGATAATAKTHHATPMGVLDQALLEMGKPKSHRS